jgi:hypothetical protein
MCCAHNARSLLRSEQGKIPRGVDEDSTIVGDDVSFEQTNPMTIGGHRDLNHPAVQFGQSSDDVTRWFRLEEGSWHRRRDVGDSGKFQLSDT